MFMTIGLLPRIASAPDAPKWNDEVCASRERVSRLLNETRRRARERACSCDHRDVPPLGAKQRANLPDSAFAYIDSTGKRRLPINGASHVRNAFSRFDQVHSRVRVGVHSGRPTLTETGHVGLSVHTAASSCHAAHGGQIVLSSPVQAALLDPLADGVTLRSLGAWRFHGIREPRPLFQPDVGDLPATCPPLRSGDPVT